MRISIDSPFPNLINEAQDESVKKENRMQERIRGKIDNFSTDGRDY